MDYWSVEVMYYDDGHQAFNTYMVKARGQWHREHLFASYEPDVSARLSYTDYWSA